MELASHQEQGTDMDYRCHTIREEDSPDMYPGIVAVQTRDGNYAQYRTVWTATFASWYENGARDAEEATAELTAWMERRPADATARSMREDYTRNREMHR